MKQRVFTAIVTLLTLYHLWHIHISGYTAIHWYSPLLCYTTIYLWLLLLTKVVTNSNYRKNLTLLFSTLFLLITCLEIGLRTNGRLMSYHERRYGYYKSPFQADQKTWYHTWSPNSTHYLESTEFKYMRTTNSLGFSDVEPRLRTDSSEIRILTLGDSFTEGDGAAYDSSYPQLLKNITAINYPDAKCTLINAGVSGSDPYYDYIAHKDKLAKYSPDIVLYMISTNDLIDIYYRGGMERFNKDGTVSYNLPPKIEPAIAISVALRLFSFPFYRKSVIPRIQEKKIYDTEANDLIALYKKIDSVASQQNFKVHIIIRPDTEECKAQKYDYDFTSFINTLSNLPNTTCTNLLEYYMQKKATGDDTYKYYWPIDKHHNASGYKLMAEGVYKDVTPLIDTLLANRYSAK